MQDVKSSHALRLVQPLALGRIHTRTRVVDTLYNCIMHGSRTVSAINLMGALKTSLQYHVVDSAE